VASFPLRGLVELVLAGRAWRMRDDDLWCHLSPPGHRLRVQGWKLHVSATVVSAPLVLQRAAAVLVASGCAFKFARTLERVGELTGKQADRAQAGKFLTAYPRDDDHLRELAELLDEATAGLPGPAILSDRPFREGSLVHYRYGAFAGVPVLTNDGSFEVRLQAPDGTLVVDVRQPWFCPPAWAELPFPGRPGRAPRRPPEPRPVLLADRFEVRGTITTSARGGVYRAVDRQTGRNVVIKRARPHISGLVWQGDAREGLRREAEVLGRLEGLAAQPVTTFEQDGNVFLVLAEVPGQPLSLWVQDRLHQRATTGDGGGLPVAEVLALTGGLADLLDAVHARGLVYRDLTPNNVMVTDDGGLRLIDAELAAVRGEWVATAQTRGYGAPEIPRARVAPAPDPAADCYSLGAVLFYLTTGLAPVFPPDSAPDPAAGSAPDSAAARPARQRLAHVLRYAGAGAPAARRLAPAIHGLTDPDPATRWSTATLRQWLATPAARDPGGSAAGLEPERQQRLLDDGLAQLVAHSDTTSREPAAPAPRGRCTTRPGCSATRRWSPGR
jgi:serine/threonine protein kinase